MLVVGSNLKKLISQLSLIDDPNSFDEQSLTLHLNRSVIWVVPPAAEQVVTYGQDLPQNWQKPETLSDQGLSLGPQACVLACSRETVSIPLGFFGLLQTKGSLARLFVTVQASDGQVEAGYQGQITFEMINLAPFSVLIPPDSAVAQLFIFRATTREYTPYKGRYQNAQSPTVSRRLY